jgi:protein-tyrosine phosphatase
MALASFGCHVPVLDLVVPSVAQLESAVQAIDAVNESRPTLVFCALGYSRGAMAVAAWLMAKGYAASANEAVALIRAQRAPIALSPMHLDRLEAWKEGNTCSRSS